MYTKIQGLGGVHVSGFAAYGQHTILVLLADQIRSNLHNLQPSTPRPIPKEPVLPSALHHLSHRSYSYLVLSNQSSYNFSWPAKVAQGCAQRQSNSARTRETETSGNARCLSILPPSAFLFNPGGQNDDRGKVVCPCPLKRILLQHPIHQHRHHTPHTRTARVSVVNTRTWARISPSSRKRRLPTLRGTRTVSDGCVASRWHHMLALLHLTY
jgi:hypothetical protein